MTFSRVSAQYGLHQNKMYTQPPPPPGRVHGRGRLRGSNVLTCCTWARTRRVDIISDGRYFGLLWYDVTVLGYYDNRLVFC